MWNSIDHNDHFGPWSSKYAGKDKSSELERQSPDTATVAVTDFSTNVGGNARSQAYRPYSHNVSTEPPRPYTGT